MDVPSPAAGTVREVLVSINDKVSEGTPIVVLEGGSGEGSGGEEGSEAPKEEGSEAPAASEKPEGDAESRNIDDSRGNSTSRREEAPAGKRVVVVGSGPGGYTAAFPCCGSRARGHAGRAP